MHKVLAKKANFAVYFKQQQTENQRAMTKKIKSALISVYHKDHLDELIKELHKHDVKIYSTGGTQAFIEGLGVPVIAVETLTEYPSILGGRVKTLHPKVFGGILARRDNPQDISTLAEFGIPEIDLVIVDLYPFEETLKTTDDESTIIEKIDIGGVSLIRAAAKNYKDTIIIADFAEYGNLKNIISAKNGGTEIEDRRYFATQAFKKTAHYDTAIGNYFAGVNDVHMRYGENPHQSAFFRGNLDEVFAQLHGKELSYNNLNDTDAALGLLNEFSEPTFVIIKHTNPCGLASDSNLTQAWHKALAGDPVSSFGGIIACNRTIDAETAKEINNLFFEVLVAPDFEQDALEILQKKKDRRLLKLHSIPQPKTVHKTLLNGTIYQDADNAVVTEANFSYATNRKPTQQEVADILLANRIVKHAKSNTIVLAKNNQLMGIGCGQTSRVDALKTAIAKAKEFGLELKGCAMASDAFFPFPDCVEIADGEGITAVIQPGGSIKDSLTVDYCNQHNMAMVLTGIRHFKH